MLRKSTESELVRLAEISVFAKRVAYRPIFNNDEFSFNVLTVTGVMDVLRMHLDAIWVCEDSNIVKGFVHIEDDEVKELYVDWFFQGEGVGTNLLGFAVNNGCRFLWVLERNEHAIRFYERNGFSKTGEMLAWNDTGQFILKMTTSFSQFDEIDGGKQVEDVRS
jgi:putative acetyltransferase